MNAYSHSFTRKLLPRLQTSNKKMLFYSDYKFRHRKYRQRFSNCGWSHFKVWPWWQCGGVSCIIIYKMAVYTIVTECSSFLIIVRMKQTLLKSSAVIVNNTAFIDKWFSFGSHLRVVVHLNLQQQNTVPIY